MPCLRNHWNKANLLVSCKKPNTWCPQSTALPLESRSEIQTMPTAVAPAGTESRSDWASLWMQPWGISSPSPALSSSSCFASLTAAHLENSSRKKGVKCFVWGRGRILRSFPQTCYICYSSESVSFLPAERTSTSSAVQVKENHFGISLPLWVTNSKLANKDGIWCHPGTRCQHSGRLSDRSPTGTALTGSSPGGSSRAAQHWINPC